MIASTLANFVFALLCSFYFPAIIISFPSLNLFRSMDLFPIWVCFSAPYHQLPIILPYIVSQVLSLGFYALAGHAAKAVTAVWMSATYGALPNSCNSDSMGKVINPKT
jgi:hypothetical protein